MERTGVRRPRDGGVPRGRDRSPERPPSPGARGAHRGRHRARQPHRGAGRTRKPHPRTPAPRAALGSPDPRALPLGPTDRRPHRVPAVARDPRRRARRRSVTRASDPARADPPTGSGPRAQGRAAPRVPAAGADRRGRVRRGLPGHPAAGRAGGGDQGGASRARQPPRLRAQVRARGPDRRAPRAPAHRSALRLLARARRRLSRDAVPAWWQRRDGARNRAARAVSRRVDHRPGRLGALGGAPSGGRAPRREARQHPARRRGQRLPHGLRRGARRRVAGEDLGDDDARHAGVLVPRADPIGSGDAAIGRLCARHRPVRDAHRRAPFPG